MASHMFHFAFCYIIATIPVYGLPTDTEDYNNVTYPEERNTQRADLTEGDIHLEPEGRNVIRNLRLKWLNKTVPYIIGPTYSPRKIKIIRRAIKAISSQTCIIFVPRTNEIDYIAIVSGDGCYSKVGRRRGRQEISLEDPDCMEKGTIIHELLHVLGLWHEQSRQDRDEYVKILYKNIEPGEKLQFNKEPERRSQTLGLPYDYSSIMHYSKYAFSIDGIKPTIVTIPPGIPIGLRNDMSLIDIQKVRILYNC